MPGPGLSGLPEKSEEFVTRRFTSPTYAVEAQIAVQADPTASRGWKAGLPIEVPFGTSGPEQGPDLGCVAGCVW